MIDPHTLFIQNNPIFKEVWISTNSALHTFELEWKEWRWPVIMVQGTCHEALRAYGGEMDEEMDEEMDDDLPG